MPKAPGVYVTIAEKPSGPKPIEAVGTSTVAFLGMTPKGPLKEIVRVTRYEDYEAKFGEIIDSNSTVDYTGHSVKAFFQNGGRESYVVSMGPNGGTAVVAARTLFARTFPIIPEPDPGTSLLEISAKQAGQQGNRIVVRLTPQDPSKTNPSDDTARFMLAVGLTEGNQVREIESIAGLGFDVNDSDSYIKDRVNDISHLIDIETVHARDLDMVGVALGDQRYCRKSGKLVSLDVKQLHDLSLTVNGNAVTFKNPKILNDIAEQLTVGLGAQGIQAICGGDHLVLIANTAAELTVGGSEKALGLLQIGDDYGGYVEKAVATLPSIPIETLLSGGTDGGDGTPGDYEDVLSKLKDEDINIICLPTQHLDNTGQNPIVNAAVTHAENMANRIVLVDPPDVDVPSALSMGDMPASPHSVLYYPWLKAPNPNYRAGDLNGGKPSLSVPPSGFVAGIWAKTDAQRGVWKAPAGVQARLNGITGIQHRVRDDDQGGSLNELGINCIRTKPGYGNLVWGARTLATQSTDWRYVSVRRTAIMLKESIQNGIQWAVFEPNNEPLWAALRLSVEAFMNGLFRAGAFQGQRASEAYFVRCAKGDTMEQDDIDLGRVIILVGFAPVKPAEFVMVTIQQLLGQNAGV